MNSFENPWEYQHMRRYRRKERRRRRGTKKTDSLQFPIWKKTKRTWKNRYQFNRHQNDFQELLRMLQNIRGNCSWIKHSPLRFLSDSFPIPFRFLSDSFPIPFRPPINFPQSPSIPLNFARLNIWFRLGSIRTGEKRERMREGSRNVTASLTS